VQTQATVVNNGTCKNYYATNGACVNPGHLINNLNNNNAWLVRRALDANNFALQFVNASVYFAQQQGVINSLTQAPTSPSTFLSSVGNFFTNLANKAMSLFSTLVGWVQSLFMKNLGAINDCFQAWANITNGIYCVSTSNNNVTSSIVQSSTQNTWSIPVDQQSTGQALQSCLPLIDTYCSLTYGVSIANSANPFNTTFNWNDNGISLDNCYNIRNQTNLTNIPANNAILNGLLVSIFATNWIRFVPSANAIENYSNLFASNKTVASFNQVQQQAPVITGLNLYVLPQLNENVYNQGLNSGQPGIVYGSAFSFVSMTMLALLALMI
jgi:hypothetical protein